MNHVVSDNKELALEPLLAACLKNTIFPHLFSWIYEKSQRRQT